MVGWFYASLFPGNLPRVRRSTRWSSCHLRTNANPVLSWKRPTEALRPRHQRESETNPVLLVGDVSTSRGQGPDQRRRHQRESETVLVASPRVRRSACVDHTSLMGGERALLLDDIPCMRRKGPTLFAADPDYSIVVMFHRGLMRDV